jgi:hypothetical protein
MYDNHAPGACLVKNGIGSKKTARSFSMMLERQADF